jgi:signal transduction histidine kinase
VYRDCTTEERAPDLADSTWSGGGGNEVARSATGKTVLAGPAFTLSLITADQSLVALCRDVLREFGDPVGTPPNETGTGPEALLLDYDSGPGPIASADLRGRNVVYVVSPSRLEQLLEHMPAAEGNILLKPVTRAVLRAFLGSMNSTENGGIASAVRSLRASRDDFLQCLLHANLRLQEYDQQRTNFIARAVHDFRAPLTALSGFCGLLASGELGPLNEQQQEAVQRMEHSAKRLSRMASSMFDLSIGSKVNAKPQFQRGDLREQIKQAVYEIQPAAREKRISVRSQSLLAPTAPLYFEPSQIEQVLVNLLDNACKFTHRDGMIEVQGYPYFWERRFLRASVDRPERRAERVGSPNAYRVDVRDTGPGIPADHLAHIFEEYTSYAGPQDRSGGGLGLAICRLILSRHRGRIWAESHPEGALFSFVLPYQRGDSL